MKITLLLSGKTGEPYLREGIEKYRKRLQHYVDFNLLELPEIKGKSLSEEQQKGAEAGLILKNVEPADHLLLLDECGTAFTSIGFSGFIQKKALMNSKHLVFIVGGPYGFNEQLLQRAQDKISLSNMTFSHQMVRLFFVEQLYRAFTILKGEPYHHK